MNYIITRAMDCEGREYPEGTGGMIMQETKKTGLKLSMKLTPYHVRSHPDDYCFDNYQYRIGFYRHEGIEGRYAEFNAFDY